VCNQRVEDIFGYTTLIGFPGLKNIKLSNRGSFDIIDIRLNDFLWELKVYVVQIHLYADVQVSSEPVHFTVLTMIKDSDCINLACTNSIDNEYAQ